MAERIYIGDNLTPKLAELRWKAAQLVRAGRLAKYNIRDGLLYVMLVGETRRYVIMNDADLEKHAPGGVQPSLENTGRNQHNARGSHNGRGAPGAYGQRGRSSGRGHQNSMSNNGEGNGNRRNNPWTGRSSELFNNN